MYLLCDKFYCQRSPQDFWLLVNSECAPVVDGVFDGNDIANL